MISPININFHFNIFHPLISGLFGFGSLINGFLGAGSLIKGFAGLSGSGFLSGLESSCFVIVFSIILNDNSNFIPFLQLTNMDNRLFKRLKSISN